MLREYSKEELWKLYETLPEELKEAIFSEKIAEDMFRICERYGIEECSKLSKIVGYTFLGVLPPFEIQKVLQKELFLSSEKAKRISDELYRFVFYPLKNSLASLYSKEFKIPQEKEEEEAKIKKEIEEKRDIYREPIE